MKKQNHKKEPYIDNRHVCASCGNIGKCDPVTSMCYDCGEDNWIECSENLKSGKIKIMIN